MTNINCGTDAPVKNICPSEREVFLLEGEARAVLGVELREPPPVFDDELVFSYQQWLEGITLVVPRYHIPLQLQHNNNNNIVIISPVAIYFSVVMR